MPEAIEPSSLAAPELTASSPSRSKVGQQTSSEFSRLILPTAALMVLVITFQQVAQPDLVAVYRDPVIRLITLLALLAGAGLLALRYYEVVHRATLLSLGLGFQVIVAFAIALVETAVPIAADRPVLGLSAVAPWMLFMCVLVRTSPARMLLVSLAAASTWPLAYAINVSRLNLPVAPSGRLIVWPAINYLVAVLACLISRRLAGPAPAAGLSSALGPYRLLAPIGVGGMGEVWKASHEMLARQAAIKLVRPRTNAASPRQIDLWVERFRREANVIASLQSPNTIYLYDFGISRDGQFYYVMELLDGISLEALVTTFGPLPPARVRTILMQICSSLEEAHQLGLVHRDLKPSNVMLCKVALTYDFVKVLDFGLAKCAACEDVTQLTMEGVTAGTPGYIAPEVALGEAKIDGRADIYALGCVAYYLLTGTLVFEDTNPMSMALKHVQAAPDPPSSRTELPIPSDLERLVMQCLEKQPADRPRSVRDVADCLGQCAFGEWSTADAAAWWDSHLPETSSLRTVKSSTAVMAQVQPL